MAESTITGLPNATLPLSGAERLPMDQAGTTVDASSQDIANLAGAAITAAIGSHVASSDPHPGYLLENDPAVTNSRTPTAHKNSHATDGADALTPGDIGAATAAQGALADTAVQPGALSAVATSGAYGDLSGRPLPGDVIVLACSDETTDLATGTAKVTFRMPWAATLTDVRLSVNTAPTGSALIVDVNEGGVSVFGTLPQIDDGDTTSVGSVVAPVISDSALAADAEITVDIDQVGSSAAGRGLKVALYVTRV